MLNIKSTYFGECILNTIDRFGIKIWKIQHLFVFELCHICLLSSDKSIPKIYHLSFFNGILNGYRPNSA